MTDQSLKTEFAQVIEKFGVTYPHTFGSSVFLDKDTRDCKKPVSYRLGATKISDPESVCDGPVFSVRLFWTKGHKEKEIQHISRNKLWSLEKALKHISDWEESMQSDAGHEMLPEIRNDLIFNPHFKMVAELMGIDLEPDKKPEEPAVKKLGLN